MPGQNNTAQHQHEDRALQQNATASQAIRDMLQEAYYLDRIGFFIFPVLEVPVIKDERSG
jgi:hypothetical protein